MESYLILDPLRATSAAGTLGPCPIEACQGLTSGSSVYTAQDSGRQTTRRRYHRPALAVAEAVTGIEIAVHARGPRINLLDSALHAPQASFGGHDMYPEFLDQAAVLAVRISRKSPASRRKQAPRLGRRECRQSSRSTHTASHWANPASSKSPAATESIVLTASSLGTCRSCPLSAQNMVRQPWITLSSP
jgi:hypothetical protein